MYIKNMHTDINTRAPGRFWSTSLRAYFRTNTRKYTHGVNTGKYTHGVDSGAAFTLGSPPDCFHTRMMSSFVCLIIDRHSRPHHHTHTHTHTYSHLFFSFSCVHVMWVDERMGIDRLHGYTFHYAFVNACMCI